MVVCELVTRLATSARQTELGEPSARRGGGVYGCHGYSRAVLGNCGWVDVNGGCRGHSIPRWLDVTSIIMSRIGYTKLKSPIRSILLFRVRFVLSCVYEVVEHTPPAWQDQVILRRSMLYTYIDPIT